MLNLQTVNTVLIIRLSSLGDILLTTPLIRSLKSKYPDIQIDFLLKEQYKGTVQHNPHLRSVYTLNENYDELAGIISKNKYDLIIDLQNNLRSHKLTRKTRSKKVRFKKHDIKKMLLVKFKINMLKGLPQIPVRYSNTIKGFNLDDKGLEIFIHEDKVSNLTDDRNYIGIAPGSRHFTKMWPSYYYIYLCKMLTVNDFTVVLLGGKKDKEICNEISELFPKAINLCNEDDILQTVTNMKKCRAIVCNDSGLMHAACAAGVPVVSFFGSTVKEFGFTPYNNKNLILENNSLSCRPCSHIGRDKCPKSHFNCMKEITPQMAFKNINLLLNT